MINVNDINPQMIQALIDRVEVLEKMVYNFNAKGVTKGILKGIQVQEVTTATDTEQEVVLADLYKNNNGGTLEINDISGKLNVKLGSESGSTDNVGGTIILYNDSPTHSISGSMPYRRFEAGIDRSTDGAIVNLRDWSGNVKVGLYANDANLGSIMFLCDASGNPITYLTATSGKINNQNIATQDWVMNYIGGGTP